MRPSAQSHDGLALFLGRNPGHDLVNAKLLGHGIGCGLTIAGQHDDAQSLPAQLGQCGSGIGPYCVREIQ